MKKQTINITNCWECPFCNNDNEYGRDNCNLSNDVYIMTDQLPEDTIHENCPLRTKSVIVNIDKSVPIPIPQPPQPPKDIIKNF